MNRLYEFAAREDVRNAIIVSLNTSSVQGVVVDVDRYWLAAWRVRQRYGDGWFKSYSFHPLSSDVAIDFVSGEKPDVKWTFSDWSRYVESRGWPEGSGPIFLKICLRPSFTGEPVVLPEIGTVNFPVAFEVRPLARLAAGPKSQVRPLEGGVSVGDATEAGTLGGVLDDGHGQRYGVTCAHVLAVHAAVDQPASADGAAQPIGTCAHRSNLVATHANAICNPYAGGSINQIDAALVKIDPQIISALSVLSLGSLTGVTSKAQLTPGQTIEIVGKESGYVTREVGGLAVAYRLVSNTNVYYCFKDLFEIRHRSTASNIIGPPVNGGDSGAWVCDANGSGYSWGGMVIGTDRFNGYATFAELIDDWISGPSPVGLGLALSVK